MEKRRGGNMEESCQRVREDTWGGKGDGDEKGDARGGMGWRD